MAGQRKKRRRPEKIFTAEKPRVLPARELGAAPLDRAGGRRSVAAALAAPPSSPARTARRSRFSATALGTRFCVNHATAHGGTRQRERTFPSLLATSLAPALSSPNRARSSHLLLAGMCVAAIVARSWLQFGTPLAPGMNGAYYFVQARALLEHGRLGIPDLPFTFWLQAGLARLVAALTGWPQDDAIVFAVKLADSVLPPLVALPVLWLGARWHRNNGPAPSRLAMLAPAAIVCASAAPLSMTGDFQKNALALIWLAGAAWATHRFLTAPNLRNAAPIALCLALLGLTHVGVLGAALVFLFLIAAAATLVSSAAVRKRVLLAGLASAAVLAAAAAVTYRYDPARVHRLWRAFAQPSSVVSDAHGPGGPRMGPPPGFAPDNAPPDADFPPDHRGPPAAGFGPPGGPGQMRMLHEAPRFLFWAVGLAAVVLAVARRRTLPVADFALAAAAGVSAAVLGGGFFEEQKAQRLMLIAVVPAAIAISFLLAQTHRARPRRIAGFAILILALGSGALYTTRGARAVLTTAQRDELRTLAPLIAQPERTLIVAHHGLEWWTAWTLRTHIAQPSAISREDWQRYGHVFYLTEKAPSGQRAGLGGPPGFGPPGFGPDNAVPDRATNVHDGPFYTLARVDEPPEGQRSDAEVAQHRRARQ